MRSAFDLRLVAMAIMVLAMGTAKANSDNRAADGEDQGTVHKVGHAIEHAAHATAHGVKRGAEATAHGIKVGAEATGRGVKRGAAAVGRAADKVAEKLR